MKKAAQNLERGTLYVSSDLETLAQRLASVLSAEERAAKNPFLPANIIVANNNLKKWLQLYLASQQQVCINLNIRYLEAALEKVLSEIGTVKYEHKLRIIDHDRYRLLLLSVLLDPHCGGADLQPLRDYIGVHNPAGRAFSARAWDAADRLARLIRDYEFHRQEILIQRWLKDEMAFSSAAADVQAMERCQRALFKLVVHEKDGLRARLGAYLKETIKTLPQFANEVMAGPLKPRAEWPEYLKERPIHVFGLAQISSFHVQILRWLSGQVKLHFYHVNPLAAWMAQPRSGDAAEQMLREMSNEFAGRSLLVQEDDAALKLLKKWAHAGGESLWRLAELFTRVKGSAGNCELEVLKPAARKTQDTVLKRLQDQLLNRPVPSARLAQDRTVQIVGCPGIAREVETVYHSILENMRTMPGLRLNDIAVLVPDMALYRPVIQTVFDRRIGGEAPREGRTLPYNMSDYSAAGPSVYGQALLGMLQLPLEGFGRVEVFDVLLNPCFLARLGVSREQALLWLDWAERLGIYHGWDVADKKEMSYGESRLYSWQLGLQRLRLGRIMDAAGDGEALARFQDVVPYADLHSADGQQLNAFCQAVQGLLPRLLELRRSDGSGDEWNLRLEGLMEDFLAIPADRESEEAVRQSLLNTAQTLKTVDAVRADGAPRLRLPLIVEVVQTKLAEMECGAAGYLSGGVTVSSLQPLRPIPFQVVYVLGLGEGLFPRKNVSAAFDLREVRRQPGDILNDEAQRFQFLEAVLSAREKLYLLYNCKEIQKDQDLQPCLAVTRLRQHLNNCVLPEGREFKITQAPLYGHDWAGVPRADPAITDALVNYSAAERVLAQCVGNKSAAGEAGQRVRGELLARVEAEEALSDRIPRVKIRELRKFLCDPAAAALQRHLRLRDEDESEPCNDEPFYTDGWDAENVVTATLNSVVSGAAGGKTTALSEWTTQFEQNYSERMLQGQTPEGAFAQVDARRIRKAIAQRLGEKDGVSAYLESLAQSEFIGAVQIGESERPEPAGQTFPALSVTVQGTRETAALIEGRLQFVWRTEKALESLYICSANSPSGKAPVPKMVLDPVLTFFALLAGEESAAWLGGRKFKLAVCYKDALEKYEYSACSANEARSYLARLTAAFLNPAAFDALPLDVIVGERDLHGPFGSATVNAAQKQAYAARLAEAIEDADEKQFRGQDDRLKVVELLETNVPADAFEKVQERFGLICGLRVNEQPAEKAPAKAAPAKAKRKGGKA